MVELSSVNGKSLAIVLYKIVKGKKEEGAVFFGTARVKGKKLYLDRGKKGPIFEIPETGVRRLAKTDQEVKEILGGGDYWLWLTVVDLPKDEDATKYFTTGLKWPK